MPNRPSNLVFPYTEKLGEGVAPTPEPFEWIYQGKGTLGRLEYGYALVEGLPGGEQRILLFFQRKPYAAAVLKGPGDLSSTTIRDFFSAISASPSCRLDFFFTDPILLKSLLVLTQKAPRTEGSAEVIRLTGLVIDLMEEHKDALMAVVQGNRYGLVFAKGGRIVKAYFSQRFLQSQLGMDWEDLLNQIEMDLIKGEAVLLQVYENLVTQPAVDYLEGVARFTGGVFRHYTRPLPELIVRFQGRTSSRITVQRFPFVIGRAEDIDLTLRDPGISRRHASIEEGEGGQLVIRDLGSLNGLFVNNRQVKEAPLADGDRVTLGDHALHVIFPRPASADVPLVPAAANADNTIALGQKAQLPLECPHCGARGKIDASLFYAMKSPQIRCPRCSKAFTPVPCK